MKARIEFFYVYLKRTRSLALQFGEDHFQVAVTLPSLITPSTGKVPNEAVRRNGQMESKQAGHRYHVNNGG
jgi:hypothetical protein